MYARTYKDLKRKPMDIDYTQSVEGFRPENKIWAIIVIAGILTLIYMAFVHVKTVDHNSMRVYATPIENHRISPRTNTSDYLFNSVKQ